MASKLLPHPIHYCLVTLLLQDAYSYPRSFNLEISATTNYDVDIGWISHATVSLFYRRRLIGEKTLRDMHILPDENNEVEIKLDGLNIQNMIGFKTFIQRVMPETKATRQKEGKPSITAALDNDENGHELSIAIDLSTMSSGSILRPVIKLVDGKVQISFTTSSSNPVDMPFGWCQFILKKGKKILAFMDGHFDIQPDTCDIIMEGDAIATKAEFSGMGVLKGFKTYDSNSWLAHAIRLFEIDVNLDKLVTESGKANGGGERVEKGKANGKTKRDEDYDDEGSESESGSDA
ncbi:hypothetical protein THAR02_00475 [Trichoderma harzianum]|uniref:Uncharacterized protein n=1 Tax=Trichoderma harzianum TaxID=5544 RepID=A0A0F9Y5S9_TRIHA|nr:hypothetical protein THAR02_00475 [Trichoderma harzianum]